MNKFTATGIVQATRDGARILVVTENDRALDDALAELEQQIDESILVRIVRVSGRAGIRFPNGAFIRVCTWRRAAVEVRGVKLDVVYLDAGVDQVLRDLDVLCALNASLDSNRAGELIRA